ncbi:hypothetical protein [Pseudokineococcus lusitanus]|uniref:DUF4352 domain-containing protein n=1 Tax=Pseudokineococcus lusitanus TaxID=763993 RepID=A0A3N1HKI0_9ACTN|nr:hypothetical protein [Pseudokineococcus lusitanus]ROP42990.1 hypothetical protein EDC03_2284 [Pseudokineococcus lusitanus]
MTALVGRRAAAAALAALLALPLAACSSGDDAAPAPPSSAAPTGAVPTAGPSASSTTTPADPTAAPPTDGSTPVPEDPATDDGTGGSSDGPPLADPRPTAAVETLPPVPAGEDAALSDGVVVRVLDVRQEEVTATAPGDVGGPAALVRLTARNGSDAEADLTGLAVTAAVDGAPAPPLTVEQASLLGGTLAPGATAEGTYVFGLGDGDLSTLVVDVSSGTSSTVVRVEP